MDEPLTKKFKTEKNDIEQELQMLQEHLLENNCLCTLSETKLQKSIWKFHSCKDLWTDVTSNWSRNQILMLVSSIQLLCDTAMKQNANNFVCTRIANICYSLINNENSLIDYFLELADDSDQFISFAANRALSSFFIVVKVVNLDQRWLNRLTDIIVQSQNPNKLEFSLDILKRVINWRDFILDDNLTQDEEPSDNCEPMAALDTEGIDNSLVRCLCIKSLESKWVTIVSKFNDLITSNSQSYHLSIIKFLNLWKAIIAVKANLSINATELFYFNINSYVSFLSSNTPPIIWKHLLNLFNEVLCYGSTLALQDSALEQEPCTLAHVIIRSVKDRRLLTIVPCRESSGVFGDGNGEADKALLMKLVILILKAVALTVKETQCDSSSDSSLGSEIDDNDADMVIIERSLREVYQQLDNFIKTVLPIHPETKVAQWIIQVFSGQDDYLLESMLCCLDVSIGLYNKHNALSDLPHILNPYLTFLQFLESVSFNSNQLLSFLLSSYTCFLAYILQMLKYICRNWDEFVYTCGRAIDDVMSSLIRLKTLIENLISINLFPYNVNPVLKLLRKCEQFYEQTILLFTDN